MEQLFCEVALLPEAGDNIAIAARCIEKGTSIVLEGGARVKTSHTVLEGHRFAVEQLALGDALLSWGLPFGRALQPIAPGDYVCNDKMIKFLTRRGVDFELPKKANFEDYSYDYVLDEAAIVPCEQVPLLPPDILATKTFNGFKREFGRGVGTRNYVLLLPTTSLASGFVISLEAATKPLADTFSNVTNVVCMPHTEAGGDVIPNNYDLVVRTLAGMAIHPNVGAVLIVDCSGAVITGATLQVISNLHYVDANGKPSRILRARSEPLAGVTVTFVILASDPLVDYCVQALYKATAYQ
eukprot:TRINITY_DN1492_c0_g1_i1.p1 TRINITY_DN1492_c0_g1~~TRINITY_DN1492_c0_g1_i1.p1  ORF type:complete len:307 (+),score=74.41 TRINITY_DN1492_c0_g1_i1:31-921(+)